ncbi:MAG: hypothetical protein ABI550_01390 [Ignavibacteriaceae bacterium]
MKTKMKLIIFLAVFICSFTLAQNKIEKIKGDVKVQIGSSENWINAKEGMELKNNWFISTGENSSVQINYQEGKFSLKENSAISISDIKKMTVDELILALAMEDMINAPKKNEKTKSENTAVYGTEQTKNDQIIIDNSSFGVKRLNGAMQLSENGFKESAVIFAKETYRKYPSTKLLADMKIYFADVLNELGLYEEAYDEFNSAKSLTMTDQEKKEVELKLNSLSKKLISNQ